MEKDKLKKTRLRTWLYFTSGAILLAGLVGAVLIYWEAVNAPAEESGYEVIGGFVYPGGGAYNKKYLHDLQLYGGSAAVLGDRFTRWFNGLWHGTSLSYTVAVIACLLAIVVFVAANNVPARSRSVARREDNPDETT